jgi:hypothetical protein
MADWTPLEIRKFLASGKSMGTSFAGLPDDASRYVAIDVVRRTSLASIRMSGLWNVRV